MPRYFFHVQTYSDDRGTVLPDLSSAQAAALATLCETLPDLGPELWKNGAVQVTVSDEDGAPLLALETRVTSHSGDTTPSQR